VEEEEAWRAAVAGIDGGCCCCRREVCLVSVGTNIDVLCVVGVCIVCMLRRAGMAVVECGAARRRNRAEALIGVVSSSSKAAGAEGKEEMQAHSSYPACAIRAALS